MEFAIVKRLLIRLGVILGLLRAVAFGGDPAGPLELKDGDRVVLIGGTLVERDQESGYLETRLIRRYPGRSIVFRNLGWSGDTVDGISRGESLGSGAGFRQLVDHVVALKPTVIVLGYGANESFGGQAGLPAFQAGLDRLWDELARTGARMVVLTPNRQENLGPPLPDPGAHNADLRRYRDLLWSEAARRGAIGVDLFLAPPNQRPWTTNGIHLSPSGYWQASGLIAPALSGTPVAPWRVAIEGGKVTATSATVSDLTPTPTGLKFQLRPDFLPDPPFPFTNDEWVNPQQPYRLLQVTGLDPEFFYNLKIDGQQRHGGNLKAWKGGIIVLNDPELAHVEALRKEINRKNLMYFHRWRPQNETYLFGFRKHEQGKNAAELAAFDPLIAAAEAEIVRLSRPVAHSYELIRTPEPNPAPVVPAVAHSQEPIRMPKREVPR